MSVLDRDIDLAHTRRVCDEAYQLISEAKIEIQNGRSARVPMLLSLARGRLKDNGLTTPKEER